jgi:glycosyltransferase involved in cell wall biosynthesis
MITALCVTYGRVKWLQSALSDFLSQVNPGPSELLIVNTLPSQRLEGTFPNVRILNLGYRPDSLGEARNLGVEAAQGDRIVVFDDDDRYLPHFLRVFAENWGQDDEWLWLDKRWWAEGDEIKGMVGGCHGGCFGFTKEAWKAMGGYPQITVGEDRVLVSQITQRFKGRRVMFDNAMPPFICCWSNGVYHISGGGEDKPNAVSAHTRIAAELSRRTATGQEKTGKIVLKPTFDKSWLAKVEAFMESELKKNSMNDVCVVELGRYGDIINILPILKHMHDTMGKPTLMVAREFANVLDGVSYVTPYPVDFSFEWLDTALKLAHEKFGIVVRCQICGRGYKHDPKTSNFNLESWNMAGFMHEFHNPNWKPVFDRRNLEMESCIFSKMSRTKLPKIVTNLTQATTAPLPGGKEILAQLQARWFGKYEVVDIGSFKLQHIYDLVGILERAALFVTIDTATLHLAAACNVPLICVVREGWLGSLPRFNCVGRFTYNDLGENPAIMNVKIDEFLGQL